MARFYCSLPLKIGMQLDLPEAVAHHLYVVRMQAGDELTLFNGEGGEYLAHVVSVEKKRATALIKTFIAREAELPYALTLAQALPEGSKMDWIIEKAVELGVASVQPLAAQRCVVRLSGERTERKLAHWQGVIIAASEQSGRNRLCHLSPLESLQEYLAVQGLHKRVILTPRATQSLADWARHQPAQPLTVMVGPEGGFSEAEEDAAIKSGALPLSMGARILRTETAGLAAAATLAALWH